VTPVSSVLRMFSCDMVTVAAPRAEAAIPFMSST
jgi:hypothetical protein